MRFVSILASVGFAALPYLTRASPLLETRQEAAPSQFYLQTQVYPGIDDCGTNKDGLYVFSYHTGAGLGIAAAEADQLSSWFYLNDTNLLFTYEDNEIGPWPTEILYGPYQAFNQISISIADGPATPGFFVNGTGLQQNTTAAWLACDWWFTDPQIFAYNGYYSTPLPSSCSFVNLIPRAVA